MWVGTCVSENHDLYMMRTILDQNVQEKKGYRSSIFDFDVFSSFDEWSNISRGV